jgi:hypothetical protein
MYATIFGIFAWFAPMLDRKLKGLQPWEQTMNQHYYRDGEAQPRGTNPQTLGYVSNSEGSLGGSREKQM